MRFVIKQEKLKDMLEKLMVKDILPKVILVAKGKEIMSFQTEEHARAFRLLKLNESYFESIDEVKDEEAIEFDARQVIGIIKTIPANINITWETKGNKVELSVENREFGIAIFKPQKVEKQLPFEMKKGIPTWDDKSLDIHLSIDMQILKESSRYAMILKPTLYHLFIDGDYLILRVGPDNNFEDFALIQVDKRYIKKGSELNVILDYGISQIGYSFGPRTCIWIGTDMPAWFYEKTAEYFLGVLLPPYSEGGW